jgi:cold shock CspA family protein
MPADKQRKVPQRAVGRLVKWDTDRGFGFVRRDYGEDVFVSAKDVRHSGLNDDDLQVGTRLSFVPWPDEKSGRAPRAIHIRVEATA